MKYFILNFGIICAIPLGISQLLGIIGGGNSQQIPYCSVDSWNSTFPQCNADVYTALANARTVHGNNDRPDGLMPAWVNINLALQGQIFANKYFTSVLFGHLMGLLAAFGMQDATGVLMFTGASDGFTISEKRYVATATQVILWYQNLFGPTANSSQTADMLLSLTNVRSLHINAARRASEAIANNTPLVNHTIWDNYQITTVLNGPFFEDLLASNIPENQRGLNPVPPNAWTNVTAVPINQQIQAMTQFAFVAYPVLFTQQFGIGAASEQEIWAFNHLWAVLGYAIGIDDQYNIALQPNLAAARATYKKIWEGYFVPSLFLLKDNNATKAFCDSLLVVFGQMFQGTLTGNVILHQLLTTVMQIPAPATYAALTPQDKLLDSTLSGYFAAFPVNQLLLPVVNAGVNLGFYGEGVKVYGVNYTTQHLRAKYVYYPDPEGI